MNVVSEETLVSWAQEWCDRNRDRMIAYVLEHYPHLPSPMVEAMFEQLWNRLVNRIVKDFGCTRGEAELAQARGLDFIVSIQGEDPSSPDAEQDRGWHNFLQYSLEYEALCHILFGRLVHHLPNDVTGWP